MSKMDTLEVFWTNRTASAKALRKDMFGEEIEEGENETGTAGLGGFIRPIAFTPSEVEATGGFWAEEHGLTYIRCVEN